MRFKERAYDDTNTHATSTNSPLMIYTKYSLSHSLYMGRYYYFTFRVLKPTFFKRYSYKIEQNKPKLNVVPKV